MTNKIVQSNNNRLIKNALLAFNKKNPDTAATIQDNRFANENNIIHILTNYFESSSNNQSIIRLLQIIMLLRYIHRHGSDATNANPYIKDKVKLYQLLAKFTFNFKSLFETALIHNHANTFYADIDAVMIANLQFLHSESLKNQKVMNRLLKKSVTNKVKSLSESALIIFNNLIEIDSNFKIFKSKACSEANTILNAMIMHTNSYSQQTTYKIVIFMLSFPFLNSLSAETQRANAEIMASLALKSNDTTLKALILKAACDFLSGKNPNANNFTRLLVLELLAKNLSLHDLIYFRSELNKSKFAVSRDILEKIHELKFGLNGYPYFNTQCNAFLKRYSDKNSSVKQIHLLPKDMNDIWGNPAYYEPTIIKTIFCTDFADPNLSLNKATIGNIYTLIKKINAFNINKITENNMPLLDEKANLTNIQLLITEMMQRAYDNAAWAWLARSPIIRFQITSYLYKKTLGMTAAKGLIDHEIYCSIDYLGYGKYAWFDPEQGEIHFTDTETDKFTLAKYILKACQIRPAIAQLLNEGWIAKIKVNRYSNFVKDPFPTTPMLWQAQQSRKMIDYPIRRAKTMPNL